METQEKTLTPEESLKLISQTIANYKRNYKEEGYYFLLWGWVCALASLSHFGIIKVLLNLKYFNLIGTFSFINWGLFLSVGMILAYRHRYRQTITVSSHLKKFTAILWQVNGIAIAISVFLSFKFKVSPIPLILLVVGSATLITGMLIKYKPLILGGATLFLFCVITSFFPNEYQLLFNALALGLGYLIPGYMLQNFKE
jgi:hypothetical protein